MCVAGNHGAKLHGLSSLIPNTHFFMHDFNLARNFNQDALSKLLISVFPIHSILFYFGNLYAILDKLAEEGVTLTFHRAYNTLIGLTGYTLKTGSDQQLMSIAEYWGYTTSSSTRISTLQASAQ